MGNLTIFTTDDFLRPVFSERLHQPEFTVWLPISAALLSPVLQGCLVAVNPHQKLGRLKQLATVTETCKSNYAVVPSASYTQVSILKLYTQVASA